MKLSVKAQQFNLEIKISHLWVYIKTKKKFCSSGENVCKIKLQFETTVVCCKYHYNFFSYNYI